MAGELDSARLKYEISQKTGLKNSAFSAHIIGSHNDDMVALQSNVSVDLGGEFDAVAQEAKTGGAKIVKLLGTSAYYAPGAAAVKMCEAIKTGSEQWLSCCVIEGECAGGRLVKLGKGGVREIKQPSAEEKAALEKGESQTAVNIKFLKESGVIA